MRCLVVELGADVNQVMRSGGTLLNFAAIFTALVRCLIEFGANIGAMDKYGNTALLTSAKNVTLT